LATPPSVVTITGWEATRVNTTDTTGTNLRAFVRTHAPMPPQRAALFAAELAEQLAARHREGAAQGGLVDTVRVREVDGGSRPVLGRPAGHGEAPESDVRELGAVLAQLIGMRPPTLDKPPPAPPGPSGPLWTVILDTQHADRGRRPSAAVVARRLRDAARDLLLDEASWPSAVAPPEYLPGADDPDPEQPAPAAEPAHRRRWVLLVAGAVVVLVAAAVLVATIGGGSIGGADGGTGQSPSASGPSPGPPVQVCLNPGCPAQVTFRPDGDQFSVCDKAKDDRSAVAVYSRADQPGEKSIWASAGEGTCVNQRVDIPARTRITIKACTGERADNRVVACSEPVTATA
jgi:hypothetical protein